MRCIEQWLGIYKDDVANVVRVFAQLMNSKPWLVYWHKYFLQSQTRLLSTKWGKYWRMFERILKKVKAFNKL
jgi:hypothetical protein